MSYWVISIFLLALSRFLVGSDMVVWTLLASQITLLAKEFRRKQVTGVGGFIFLSILFFGIRPLYLFVENDRGLFTGWFRINIGLYEIGDAMWWATLALLCFSIGAGLGPTIHRKWMARRMARAASAVRSVVYTTQMCVTAVGLQVVTLPFMFYMASLKRSVYRSDAGAYFYDLPMPLQAIHVFAIAIVFGRYWKCRTLGMGLLLGVSVLLLLTYTVLMRDVSNFRGFYLTGIMITGLTVMHQMKPRVGYAWLMIPILLVQPFFAHLGAERGKTNEELLESGIFEEAIGDEGLLESYWHFYKGSRDMNIFDTFVAAKEYEPRFMPYAWSWLYVPLHWIPRGLWSGKPKAGLTQDAKFARGAPLSPGIVGMFVLDGGLLWMLGSMMLLGYLLSLFDGFALSMPRGVLRSCAIGILVVNGMFLSRMMLWQYVYQVIYMMTVVTALAWWMSNWSTRGHGQTPVRRGLAGARTGDPSGDPEMLRGRPQATL